MCCCLKIRKTKVLNVLETLCIVSFIIKSHFFLVDTSDKILNDVEIQTFGQELTKSKSEGGCGFEVSFVYVNEALSF